MAEPVTDTIEEYMECIYRLQQRDGAARTSDLVNMLHVAPGTVTNTIRRLKRDGLVTHQPYKGAQLSERGRAIAVDVLRRHRLSERLLTDILHVGWDEAHREACRLEHGLTETVVRKLDDVLGHPKTCPHGNPIPSLTGETVGDEAEPLTSLRPPATGVIVKISGEETALLRYLDTLDLRPGTRLSVVETAPFNGPITVQVDDALHALGRTVASKLWIAPSPP
jgi:DtxR family Mn-dependent transcriptional regulator